MNVAHVSPRALTQLQRDLLLRHNRGGSRVGGWEAFERARDEARSLAEDAGLTVLGVGQAALGDRAFANVMRQTPWVPRQLGDALLAEIHTEALRRTPGGAQSSAQDGVRPSEGGSRILRQERVDRLLPGSDFRGVTDRDIDTALRRHRTGILELKTQLERRGVYGWLGDLRAEDVVNIGRRRDGSYVCIDYAHLHFVVDGAA